jgi:hypothetical protein
MNEVVVNKKRCFTFLNNTVQILQKPLQSLTSSITFLNNNLQTLQLNIPFLNNPLQTLRNPLRSLRVNNKKNIALLGCCALIMLSFACHKEVFNTSKNAYIYLSQDTLRFDTVFVKQGSVTQQLKIFNGVDKSLRLNNVELMGGTNSYFKINVDGVAGSKFMNVDIGANDSIYLFATVNIDSNASNLPFIIRDSVKIEYNGNTKWLQLEAYGKNATFIKTTIVTRDSTISNKMPLVILNGLVVLPNVTLTIEAGTKIYVNANAPIDIYGTLIAKGKSDSASRIIFQGIRLDNPYKDFAASWPRIYFANSSVNNVLEYCIIKNAYQGVLVDSAATNTQPKLTLNQCIFDNIYTTAVAGFATTINATNCLVSNSGNNISITGGGNYNFNFCTFASINNYYLQHKSPVFSATNITNNGVALPLFISVKNSIIYGEGGLVDNEVNIEKVGTTPYTIKFEKVVYTQKKLDNSPIIFANCFQNTPPNFVKIDASKREFDFHLQPTSPLKAQATNDSNITLDLDGKPRLVNVSDIGCFQTQ